MLSYEELKEAFVAYVENDLECAEADYVRDVLHSVCGLSDEDLVNLGLPDMVNEE